MAAIDYRITDAWADPPGETEPFHTERLVRLPRCFLCLAPPADAPPIWPRPAGPVTFGSFNAAAKIGPATVRLWSAVLAAVPGSRLALKALGLMDPATRRQLVTELAVDPARVEFLPVEPTAAGHLARYGRVDIALDTYPYHGTMTTLDALWMGVPTVTLAGPAHVSRVGASLMHNAGLGEFVAGDPGRVRRRRPTLGRRRRWPAATAGHDAGPPAGVPPDGRGDVRDRRRSGVRRHARRDPHLARGEHAPG